VVTMKSKLTFIAFYCLVLALLPSQTASVAVMSVDLGSEWMKMAIVKPGVPMEIVLNKESRRKTPVAVCLKENERLFGDGALGVSVKNPKVVYRYLQDLLGKRYDNPQVDLYRKRFPEHQLERDESRGTVLFKFSDDMQYSPEEILGMVLNYSRGLAQDFAEQPIKDAVITVPAFFNQAERRAVLQGAQMAGLKVLQLINGNTAVALNYGVFRRKDINSTAQNVMFYDMGSGSTVATIVTYQMVKTKDSGTQPQLQIQGVGYVEGLLDDIDFRAKVMRSEFEELCADLFKRVPGPVQEALNSAEMSMEEIEQVILVGGATRVPKVQEILLKAVGKYVLTRLSFSINYYECFGFLQYCEDTRVPGVNAVYFCREELAKNINADEAAAMGAVYQAAALSKAFKVKPFLVRDAAVFPIQVEFTRETEEDEGVKTLKHNKRVLFQRMAPYPQRKVITFNRYTDDFTFYVNYGDLSFLSAEDLRAFGSLNLTTVKLTGVGKSFKKHEDAESKGIKAHFNMDESGVLLLDRVESVFETIVEEKEEESTLTKLGNTISSLFGGGSSEPSTNITEPVQDEEEVPPESGKEEEGKAQGEKPSHEKQDAEEKMPESQSEEKEKAENEKADSGSDSQTEKQEPVGEEKSEEKKPSDEEVKPEDKDKKGKPQKKTKISEEIEVELEINDILNPTAEQIDSSKKNLEAFIFETQDKMYQDEYQMVLSEDEKEEISTKLSEASSWMDDEGYTAGTKELKEKLLELKKLCKSMFFKVEERKKWPDRLAALDSMLNHSSFFLRSAKLIPEDDQIFTEVELKTLEKVINETITWKNETVAEQEKRSPTERPVLLSKDIEAKLALLDREVNYLLNKAKFAKPKVKAKAKNSTSTENGKANSTEADSEKVVPPIDEPAAEKATEVPGEVEPGEKPPIEESTETGTNANHQEPSEGAANTDSAANNQENHIGDEL
ncbi:hypothetical protein Z043_105003, partial [Scleropages formosus]